MADPLVEVLNQEVEVIDWEKAERTAQVISEAIILAMPYANKDGKNRLAECGKNISNQIKDGDIELWRMNFLDAGNGRKPIGERPRTFISGGIEGDKMYFVAMDAKGVPAVDVYEGKIEQNGVILMNTRSIDVVRGGNVRDEDLSEGVWPLKEDTVPLGRRARSIIYSDANVIGVIERIPVIRPRKNDGMGK